MSSRIDPTSQPGCWPASWTKSDYAKIFSKYSRKLCGPQNTSMRKRPALWDICPGAILWLPPKSSITPSTLLRFPKLMDLNKNAFNHPVMVLDVSITGPEDAVVTFAPMTTRSSMRRRSYMRIFHSDIKNKGTSDGKDEKLDVTSTPLTAEASCLLEAKSKHGNGGRATTTSTPPSGNDDLLYLEKETEHRCMTEESYVDLSTIYSIEWRELQCYAAGQKPDGNRHRLQKTSFEKLVKRLQPRLKQPVPSWVDSNSLWEASHNRYLQGQPPKGRLPEDNEGWIEVKLRARVSRGKLGRAWEQSPYSTFRGY